ncbi:DUF4302 domain-containing protein [Xylanibacter muris]|uniref:DUF4302 domain-containing protein n=1 Tax=Xylanibacter muris TaxID=2736290 RepID=A0ABX2AL38_9BACT|nr:DUF4302 domain-containing protein [Xylanibacter muris]NPD91906.1 DUF4302 domain-containing protein [Xylanibacter muris]
MNKIFSVSLLLGLTLSFSSCVNEEDDIFDQSAAQRLNAASELYSGRLMASPNGWAMQLYPTKENETPFGNGYLLLMNFNKDHSVRVGMNNLLSNNVYREDVSSWDVITDNGPVLSFSSYNDCLHAFSDPEDLPFTTDRSEDETGTGIGGDYEFVIVDAPEDASYMMLKGKKRGTYNLLTPLQDNVDFQAYLQDVNDFQNKMFNPQSPSFDLLHVGDSVYRFEDASAGLPSIYPVDGDKVSQGGFAPFLITKRADDYYIRFRDELKFNNMTLQEFRFDSENDIFRGTDNPECYIEGDDPLRFFNDIISVQGKNWQWNENSVMSDEYSVMIKALANAFRAKNNTLQTIDFRYLGSQLYLRVTYRGRVTSFVDYKFAAVKEADGMVFEFQGSDKPAGDNMLNTLPELRTVVDNLAQKFAVAANETKFNLSTVKLISVANPELWFVVTLK